VIVKHETDEAWAIKCDRCGRLGDWADCKEDADGLAWADGFQVSSDGRGTDLCPACLAQEEVPRD